MTLDSQSQARALQRLIAAYTEDPQAGCWLWNRRLDLNGYGRMSYDGRYGLAHRVAYQILVGPIPPGMHIDHRCRVRSCVNPEHLRPVTPRENYLNSDSFAARNAAKTHCPRNHQLTPENLIPSAVRRGSRSCLTCSRERSRGLHVGKTGGRIAGFSPTHCPAGHAYTPENLESSALKRGQRRCLACHRQKARDGMRKRRLEEKARKAALGGAVTPTEGLDQTTEV